MSIEYGTIIQIRFQSKEDEQFFVERVTEDGFSLRTKEGDKLDLPFEGSGILEILIVYVPPKPDYASINHLYVGNWLKVTFTDDILYGKLIHTGDTLEIEANETRYYIPVRYGLPKDIVSIEVSAQPYQKRERLIEEMPEVVPDDLEPEPEEEEDEEYGQLFYTMDQKKTELTESLLAELTKQSQSALKRVYHQVHRFQELFEKYTQFEKNVLLKRLPENLFLDSFLKNTNKFYTPVTSHVKVKNRDYEERGIFPDYYFMYQEPPEVYEIYENENKNKKDKKEKERVDVKMMPYQEFLFKEAKVVQPYDIRTNHTEREFFPTQGEVYLMNEIVPYVVPESFVTESLILKPHIKETRRSVSILTKVNQPQYYDMFFRKNEDDLDIVTVDESYKATCIHPEKLTWFQNECPTFKSYIEHMVPSFPDFVKCYLQTDFTNLHQALRELETLHINEFNKTIFEETLTLLKKNVANLLSEREKDKKQALKMKQDVFKPEYSGLQLILQKDYNGKDTGAYYTTSELWKEGMYDSFHYYIVQYLKKNVLLQQVLSDQEMGQLIQEIKQAFGKESEERFHKIYETEQQRENDQYKWVLQDIPKGTAFITADEELYRKLLQEKNSALTLDEVKIKLNRIKELGESEIVNQFEKNIEPYIHEFLIKHKIMKGQVAIVKESKKKYRWTGEKWADLSEDFQAKKLFKIKDFHYNEDAFKKKVHDMINEFEAEKLRSQAIQKLKLESDEHKAKLDRAKREWLKETMKYHTEKYHYYELELQKEQFEPTASPYLALRNRILQEMSLENKYKAIQLFVQQYTKPGEDTHWYYCIETGTKLLPMFFMELAEAFLKTEHYPETLQLICDRQGELSDNNDFYVDKYSGFPIKQIQFDEEEDYNDRGFKDIFHSVVEKEAQLMVVDTLNPIRSALKSFLLLMGLTLEEEDLQEVLLMVEKSFLLASGEKKKQRERNQIYLYSILSHSLIYAQTLEGNVRLSKPFPDCPKSLKGYPLENSSKKGLEFVCCILAKVPKVNEPWSSMSQIKLDMLIQTSEQFMEKYVLSIQDIREKLSVKREAHEKKEELPVWKLFYPRLAPIKMVPELSSSTIDRIMGLSFALQQKIHDHVSTQSLVLVNQSLEPYLVNTCCQTNNNVFDYLLEHAKIGTTLKDLMDLIKKYKKKKNILLPYHMYNPMNTKTPIAKISESYDEPTIYRAIIKYFMFDTSAPVPEKLKKYKLVKPAEYKKNDTFDKKMELLRNTPVNENTFVSIVRDNATLFEPRKGKIVKEQETVVKNPVDDRLKKETDLFDYCMVEIDEKMKYILSKVTKKKRHDFKECIQFYNIFRSEKHNDFLPEGMEHAQWIIQILRNKINNILHVFPQKILNRKNISEGLPRHWDLDYTHEEKIVNFIQQYYNNLKLFHEDENWRTNYAKIDTTDYERWLKMTLPIPIKYTLHKYIFVSLFYDYVKVGLLEYVTVMVGIFLDEDKMALNFDKKQIDFASDRAKKSETNIKTEALKELTKEARKAQDHMKNLKLGEWGVGLEKSMFKYDKKKYGEVLLEAERIVEGMELPNEIYGTYGIDDGDNLEGFDGDEYYG